MQNVVAIDGKKTQGTCPLGALAVRAIKTFNAVHTLGEGNLCFYGLPKKILLGLVVSNEKYVHILHGHRILMAGVEIKPGTW